MNAKEILLNPTSSAVKINTASAPSVDALEKLYRYIESDFNRVNQILLDRLEASVTLIPELAGHLINAGGKRLRSMLALGAAKLCSYQGNKHLSLAAAVEFIHTATLLHDDVIDESQMRRGLEAAQIIWGNKASVLVGDYLFSRAFSLMVESESLQVLEILSRASSTIIEGEVLQLVSLGKIDIAEDAYLRMIESKTAQLFSSACQVGAVLGNQSSDRVEALRLYGLNLGILFQLIDDVLDYTANQNALGKNVGDDFREGKITYPVILAHHAADKDQKKFWYRTMIEKDQNEGDLLQALQYLNETKALIKTYEVAQIYAHRALMALSIFPESEGKTVFDELVTFCLNRGH